MTTDCIFCNASDDNVLYRGRDGTVVLDNPVRPGHVLVAVASHAESLHDVEEQEASSMMALASRAAKAIVELTGASKTYVAGIGDKDKHFHVHLLPKLADDPNLGPHVFGPEGWTSSLPGTSDDLTIDDLSGQLRQLL